MIVDIVNTSIPSKLLAIRTRLEGIFICCYSPLNRFGISKTLVQYQLCLLGYLLCYFVLSMIHYSIVCKNDVVGLLRPIIYLTLLYIGMSLIFLILW